LKQRDFGNLLKDEKLISAEAVLSPKVIPGNQ
jgi:hypothetical protein